VRRGSESKRRKSLDATGVEVVTHAPVAALPYPSFRAGQFLIEQSEPVEIFVTEIAQVKAFDEARILPRPGNLNLLSRDVATGCNLDEGLQHLLNGIGSIARLPERHARRVAKIVHHCAQPCRV
jgi:hypothetical protein